MVAFIRHAGHETGRPWVVSWGQVGWIQSFLALRDFGCGRVGAGSASASELEFGVSLYVFAFLFALRAPGHNDQSGISLAITNDKSNLNTLSPVWVPPNSYGGRIRSKLSHHPPQPITVFIARPASNSSFRGKT